MRVCSPTFPPANCQHSLPVPLQTHTHTLFRNSGVSAAARMIEIHRLTRKPPPKTHALFGAYELQKVRCIRTCSALVVLHWYLWPVRFCDHRGRCLRRLFCRHWTTDSVHRRCRIIAGRFTSWRQMKTRGAIVSHPVSWRFLFALLRRWAMHADWGSS